MSEQSGSISTIARTGLGGIVLLAFCLFTLGVFEPKFDTPILTDQTIQQVVDQGRANILNQLRWLAVAALAAFAVRRHLERFRALLTGTWPLQLLIAFCFTSIIWSDHMGISVRRCFALSVPIYCIIAAIATIERREDIGRLVYFVFWIALIANLASLPVAGAFDEKGNFRGIEASKNFLGSMGALAMLSGIAMSKLMQGFRQRFLWLLYLAGWAGLLALSASKTSIALALGVPVLLAGLAMVATLAGVGYGSVALAIFYLSTVALLVLVGSFGFRYTDLVGVLGTDETFTGRTPIWDFMLGEIGRNWQSGVGFGAFWSVGAKSPNLYSTVDYVRLINQGHNGYLDVLAGLGVIGLALIFGLLAHAAIRAERLRWTDPWLFRLAWLFLLFSIIHNTMESSLLGPFIVPWHMLVLVYVLTVRATLESASPAPVRPAAPASAPAITAGAATAASPAV